VNLLLRPDWMIVRCGLMGRIRVSPEMNEGLNRLSGSEHYRFRSARCHVMQRGSDDRGGWRSVLGDTRLAHALDDLLTTLNAGYRCRTGRPC
jgi:hypothetical protein